MDREGVIHFRPFLTRELVLRMVSEEEIFSRYGMPVVDHPFRSPLRNDKNPTCNFYRRSKDNRLIMRDYSGNFWGDCFDLVMRKTGLNYNDALYHVVDHFGGYDAQRVAPPPAVTILQVECIIRVRRRQWEQKDYDWWNIWGVSPQTLEHYNVAPLQTAWINNYQEFSCHGSHELAYVYWFGGYDYKLYFPMRDRGKGRMRFAHNNANILQGYTQLPQSGEACVITKSMKDVMALSEHGVAAVSPMSENTVVSETIQIELKSRFKRLFSLYDLDETGIRSMKAMRMRGITPLWMPRCMPKDFTDFTQRSGKENAALLVQNVRDLYDIS